MKKLLIALGVLYVSAGASFAQSSALDVAGQKIEVVDPAVVDTEATGSIGETVEITEGPQAQQPAGVSNPNVPVATTVYTYDRLGGNS
jgi:hypothetical protein